MTQRKKPLILASASPRRLEILRYFSLPLELVPHTFDERSLPWQGDGHGYAQQMAREKAATVAHRFPDRVIVAADTIVVVEDRLLNKPTDRAEAFSMLRQLSGKWHVVLSGISLFSVGKVSSRSEETRVLFQPLSDRQINEYLDLNLWADKAGGYAIQGAGALLVQRIEGCFYNVIGLPVVPLASMLLDVGIDLWDHVH